MSGPLDTKKIIEVTNDLNKSVKDSKKVFTDLYSLIEEKQQNINQTTKATQGFVEQLVKLSSKPKDENKNDTNFSNKLIDAIKNIKDELKTFNKSDDFGKIANNKKTEKSPILKFPDLSKSFNPVIDSLKEQFKSLNNLKNLDKLNVKGDIPPKESKPQNTSADPLVSILLSIKDEIRMNTRLSASMILAQNKKMVPPIASSMKQEADKFSGLVTPGLNQIVIETKLKKDGADGKGDGEKKSTDKKGGGLADKIRKSLKFIAGLDLSTEKEIQAFSMSVKLFGDVLKGISEYNIGYKDQNGEWTFPLLDTSLNLMKLEKYKVFEDLKMFQNIPYTDDSTLKNYRSFDEIIRTFGVILNSISLLGVVQKNENDEKYIPIIRTSAVMDIINQDKIMENFKLFNNIPEFDPTQFDKIKTLNDIIKTFADAITSFSQLDLKTGGKQLMGIDFGGVTILDHVKNVFGKIHKLDFGKNIKKFFDSLIFPEKLVNELRQIKGNNEYISTEEKLGHIAVVFSSFVTAFQSMASLNKDIFKSFINFKLLNSLNLGKQISKFWKNVSKVKGSEEHLKGVDVLTSLFSMIKSMDEIGFKTIKTFKKFAIITKIVNPGKTISRFLKTFNFDGDKKPVVIRNPDGTIKEVIKDLSTPEKVKLSIEAFSQIFQNLELLFKPALKSFVVTKSISMFPFKRILTKTVKSLLVDFDSIKNTNKDFKDFNQANQGDIFSNYSEFTKKSNELILNQFKFYSEVLPVAAFGSVKGGILTAILSNTLKKSIKSIFKSFNEIFTNLKKISENVSSEKMDDIFGVLSDFLNDKFFKILDKFSKFKIFFLTGEFYVTRAISKFLDQIPNLSKRIFENSDKIPSMVKNVDLIFSLILNNVKKVESYKTDKTLDDDKKEIKTFSGFVLIISALKMLPKTIKALSLSAPFIATALIALRFVDLAVVFFGRLVISAKMVYLGAKSLKMMSVALLMFSLSAIALSLSFTLVQWGPLLLGITLALTMMTIMAFISKIGGKAIMKAGMALKVMSTSLLVFSASALLSSILFSKVEFASLILGLGVLALTAFLFRTISKYKIRIALASISIAIMSMSLLLFGYSIYLYSSLLQKTDLLSILVGVAVLAGLSLLYYFIGKFAVNIIVGSIAVGFIGLSLIILGLGLMSFFNSIKDVTLEDSLMAAGIIGGLGVATYLLGLPAVFPFVILGSVALMVLGAALLVGSIGINMFTKIKWPEEKESDKMFPFMKNLAISFGLIGAFAPFIIIGSVAIALMYPAILAMSESVKLINKTNIDIKKIEKFSEGMELIAEAFAKVAFAGGTVTGLLSMLPFVKSPVKIGIESVLKSSQALTSVAEGLNNFDRLTRGLDLRSERNKDGKLVPKRGSLGERISMVLGVVNDVFSSIGSSKKQGFSVMKMLFGTDFRKSDTEDGIKSVLKSGEALKSVAEGISIFDSMTKNLNLDSEIDSKGIRRPKKGSLGEKISMVLGVVNNAFSNIGKSKNEGFSVMKLIFGNDFKDSDTEAGIKSVLKSGEALKSVSQGLFDFDSLTKNLDLSTLKDGKAGPNSIISKVSSVIGMIQSVFSSIGSETKESKSIFKSIFGTDMSKTSVEKGIDSVKDVGKVFVDIANGIKEWSNLQTKDIDIETIGKNITKVISSMSVEFAKIGEQTSGGIMGWFGGNKVKDGIDAVKGVGKVLSDVANGVKAFASLKEMGITETSFDSTKSGSISNNIKRVLELISVVFADLGAETKSIKYTDSNGVERTKIVFGNAEAIKKGIESVTGVGQELKNIAESIKVFADNEKKSVNYETVKTRLKSMVESITTVFADVGSGKLFAVENLKKGVDAVKGVGGELKSIVDSITPLKEIEKAGSFEKIKTSLKDIVITSAGLFAAIGGDENSWKRMFPDQPKPDFSKVANAKPIIESIVSSSQELKKILDAINQINPEDWNKRKTILQDLTVSPINAFKNLSDIYASSKGNIDAGLQVIPLLKDQVTNLSGAISTIDMSALGHKPIEKMTTDFKSFLNMLDKTPVKKETLQKGDMMVRFLERLSNIQSPFDKFQKSFEKYVKNFKDYTETINKMKLENLVELNKFTGLTAEIIKADTTNLETKLEMVKQYLAEILNVNQQIVSQGQNQTSPSAVTNQQVNIDLSQVQELLNNINTGIGNLNSKPSASTGNADLVNAIKSLNNLLTSSGIKIKK